MNAPDACGLTTTTKRDPIDRKALSRYLGLFCHFLGASSEQKMSGDTHPHANLHPISNGIVVLEKFFCRGLSHCGGRCRVSAALDFLANALQQFLNSLSSSFAFDVFHDKSPGGTDFDSFRMLKNDRIRKSGHELEFSPSLDTKAFSARRLQSITLILSGRSGFPARPARMVASRNPFHRERLYAKCLESNAICRHLRIFRHASCPQECRYHLTTEN
jgi:hypothetical protein